MKDFFKNLLHDYAELMGKLALYGNPVRPF